MILDNDLTVSFKNVEVLLVRLVLLGQISSIFAARKFRTEYQ